MAINCYSFIWRLSALDTIHHLADLGYDTVELMVNPPHLWPAAMGSSARKRVAKALRQRNVRVLSLAPPMLDLNLVSPAVEVRDYTKQHYIDCIRLAGEWETPYVVLVPGKTHPLLPLPNDLRDRWFNDAVLELDRAAELEGVKLTLENVPSSYLPHAKDVLERLEWIGNDRIGITYDVANAVFAHEDPAAGLEVVAPRLEFVHLSDTGLKSWAHSTIGTGVVDFPAIARSLDKIDFRGPSTLEVISQDPDRDIAASHDTLAALGWNERPDRTKT
ncbi:MAG: hypothetical protein JWQ22_977 [Devosia sp.]|nr:hypothetical protein [Devosia sp.]